MTIKLLITSSESLISQELLCEQSLITFGRSKSCTVILDHAGVSRRHFIVRFTEGFYVIIDEGSTAGTILDGAQLDPKNCYELGLSHEIIVPGFSIGLQNDNRPPRQERTTVMARKLMGKIFNDTNDVDHLPRLINCINKNIYYFHDDKASFVLGTLAHSDFVVDDDQHFAKEHVSFVRDISGLRIIPIIGAHILLNGREIIESEILNHNDKITLGITNFIYQDYHDDVAFMSEQITPKTPIISELPEPIFTPTIASLPKSNLSLLNNLDRICVGILLITLVGTFWIVSQLLS
jgi:pSer/pThr/pTyr-binding forkhead associated (FHA) protein